MRSKAPLLKRLTPITFHRPTRSGKTFPSLVTCETADGLNVEVVAKFSDGCEQGVTSLAMEMVAACLAGDLGLPIPEPYFIEATQEWVNIVPDAAQRMKMERSSPLAFGSTIVTGQYSEWTAGTQIKESMAPTAAAIILFDGIIQNPDRRTENPNCLVRDTQIRIYDHELTFSHDLVIGWQPPWAIGGLMPLETPGFHIFRQGLRGRNIDFAPIRTAWMGLSDARLSEYEDALPQEWVDARPKVEQAVQLIRDARDNIDECITELRRVLK